MAQTEETLGSLAAKVAELTSTITNYLSSEGLPQPSFAADAPAQYPAVPEVTQPRLKLIQSLSDMLHLALGGRDYIFTQSISAQHDMAILDVLNQFDFWSAVPLSGSVTQAEVAARTGLPEDLVRRFLRHAATMRLFALVPAGDGDGSGRVAHTAASAFVARSPAHRGWIAHHLEESRVACTRLPDALRRFSVGRAGAAQELGETAFALAFGGGEGDGAGTGVTFWDFIREDGEGERKGFRTGRFAQAMQAGRGSSGVDFGGLLRGGFDWEGLGEGTVVDVGGSSGHDAVVLAQTYPKLKFVIQDLPPVEEAFNGNVPEELRPRISFHPHDFFTPQPIAADVYFFKAILHDWPDKYASKILGALVPAMKPGARIILCEGVFPPTDSEEWRSLPLTSQRTLSAMDLQMLVLFNAKQRTVEDWRKLVADADSRLELANVYRLPGSAFGLLEIAFRG
ncbi:O-methyltransferase-domain-containing protein [Phialemonium atrogriseum]|uniref:O-methyltransferase-domain-containing protein n=1 Tax=Phialemonium atrogriseum TaxID=1093897 RepID=A0AAJ0C4S2_9PEZI|nr:O-methyltransferase-domain-containing protein [Phialemonium atrogriseum]KAK1770138.1 O-methyltransferase-domain-containing protein [Phialemonium atrogriseum]